MTSRAMRMAALIPLASLALVADALLSPSVASAAGDVEVSPDGVSYSSSYPGAIFDDIAVLVPGDSQQDVFFLRNSGRDAGFLRVTLSDVVSSSTDFSQALTVATSTAGHAGNPASLLAANPCWVLLEGQVVQPGAVVAITANMLLGNLRGGAGQSARATLSLKVALSDVAAGTLPPTACGTGGVTVPLLPSPGTTPNPGGQGTNDDTSNPVEPPGDSASGELPVLNLPGGIVIDPNTWHLYEELLVLILVGAFILGSGWFMLVAWRRRREADEEPESDVIM